MGVHAQFVLGNRHAIEGEIERLIALLDQIDGEPDLEDDDPAGGAIDDTGEGYELYAMLPRYGVDQTAGPMNEGEAAREHKAKALGLVRTSSGGWRRPS